MLAKTLFLKKLQAQQATAGDVNSKSGADIAAFRSEMAQLQENIAGWLFDTGIAPESSLNRVSDSLIPGGSFSVQGITLRYEKRAITFTPLFLYGHGVTGCVELSLHADGKTIPLSRLFMRAGKYSNWCCTRVGSLSLPEHAFDEEIFFGILDTLLA